MKYILGMRRKRRSQGFSILYAISLLIIIALIASYLLGIVSSGQKVSSNEVLSARALYAAESGIQIYSAGLFPVSGSAGVCSATSTIVNYTASGLQGCQSAVTCSAITSTGKTLYELTSTGTCGPGGLDRGQRTVQVKLSEID